MLCAIEIGMKNHSRRSFLAVSTAVPLFQIVPRHVLGGIGYTPPSEEITHAVIGTGGMGQGHLRLGGTRLLAICDVDKQRLGNTLSNVHDKMNMKDVKAYDDFREVIARDDIDMIHQATPPHWHALINIAAAEAGKDLWAEKPLSRTIGEGERIVEAVKRNGRVLRINTWFRFDSNWYGAGTTAMNVKKIVNSGLLGTGPLKMTLGAPTGFNWKLGIWSGKTSYTPETVPENLDYDRWLGPAPYKPYFAHRVHGSFRGYWDYDGGGLGDMGQHYMDPAQYILGKDEESPCKIIPDTVQQHHDAVLPWRRVELHWKDGTQLILDDRGGDDVALIEGSEHKVYRGLRSTYPNLKAEVDGLPDLEPRITDFKESVRTRKPFALNETNGHRSCTLINLALIALRLGRPIEFDDATQRCPNDPAANALIDQPMRGPWTLDSVL